MSPYQNIPKELWSERTELLVATHPLSDTIVNICLNTWKSILNGKINSYLNLIIRDMNLSPQAISNLFHDIVPEYIIRNSTDWRKGVTAGEKDLEYTPNNYYSTEIKTSSSKNSIFGNRSYGQKSNDSKKSKNGYYLAVNIDKLTIKDPKIRLVRLGWLDHSDWISQKSQTGQQSRLSKDTLDLKFKTLYCSE